MPQINKMPRQFKKAIQWIANEDNAGDDDNTETLSNYISVCLVADLWRVNRLWVAQLIWHTRHPITQLNH